MEFFLEIIVVFVVIWLFYKRYTVIQLYELYTSRESLSKSFSKYFSIFGSFHSRFFHLYVVFSFLCISFSFMYLFFKL